MRLRPEPTFDCLFLGEQLQRDTGSFSEAEVHLFAYLSCLLWLYEKRALAEWGYGFVGTELGAPFSLDIDTTIRELHVRGLVVRVHDRFSVSTSVASELVGLQSLVLNEERAQCLDAACSSISLFTTGMVGNALSQEPELNRARAVPANRQLLEDAAQAQLYEQFEALRQGLGHSLPDLRVPAVVWLSALHRVSASEA